MPRCTKALPRLFYLKPTKPFITPSVREGTHHLEQEPVPWSVTQHNGTVAQKAAQQPPVPTTPVPTQQATLPLRQMGHLCHLFLLVGSQLSKPKKHNSGTFQEKENFASLLFTGSSVPGLTPSFKLLLNSGAASASGCQLR